MINKNEQKTQNKKLSNQLTSRHIHAKRTSAVGRYLKTKCFIQLFKYISNFTLSQMTLVVLHKKITNQYHILFKKLNTFNVKQIKKLKSELKICCVTGNDYV